MRLEGKTAIVTGAAQGMGKAHAHALAREGARVVMTDIAADGVEHAAKEVRETGAIARAVAMDVSSEADWIKMCKQAYDEFGHISVLVNNAAIVHSEPAAVHDLTSLSRVFAINSTGVFLGCKSVLPYMRKQKSGSIINISSMSANLAVPGTLAYSGAKGSINAMTRVFASENGEYGIRVNVIMPAGTHTPMLDAIVETGGAALDALVQPTCLKRLARPEEVSSVVVFLASQESSYITGAEIPVDGGVGITW